MPVHRPPLLLSGNGDDPSVGPAGVQVILDMEGVSMDMHSWNEAEECIDSAA